MKHLLLLCLFCIGFLATACQKDDPRPAPQPGKPYSRIRPA